MWLVALTLFVILSTGASSWAQERTISFRNMHTNETLTVTYKRNGQYIPDAMRQIDHVLRDWRRNEAIRMNPKLIDLAYDVHKATGSQEPINVVSGYRSPVTNAALRRRSRGVAKRSQHILGNAMDMYLPDVTVKTIRETALKFQRGGVGYYPTSGRPFVHIDVGRVRHWPRMPRQQLAQLFPNGNTKHIPSDGRPLPRKARSTDIRVASADTAPQAPATATEASRPQRQQVARPTPGVDPLIVASISPDVSAPVSPRGGANPLAVLGLGDSSETVSSPPSAAPPQMAGEQSDESPAENIQIASAPLPDMRPAQDASLDTGADTPAGQQPIAIASALPMPTARPQAPRDTSSRLALAYAGEATPPTAPDGLQLASLASAGSSTNQTIEPDRMAALIQDELGIDDAGIWSDGFDSGDAQNRDLISNERAESQAFAQLRAPRLINLQDLTIPPRYSLDLPFSRLGDSTTPNRFQGPAVRPLRLAAL